MNYGKLSFEGDFPDCASMYNTIKSCGDHSVKEIYQYAAVHGEVESDLTGWAGKSKDSMCTTVGTIDSNCLSYYSYASLLVAKTQVVYGVLYPDLESLKGTIELYNACIDQRDEIASRLAAARAKKNSKNT